MFKFFVFFSIYDYYESHFYSLSIFYYSIKNKITIPILVMELSWFHGMSLEFLHHGFMSMDDKSLVLKDVQVVHKSQLSR